LIESGSLSCDSVEFAALSRDLLHKDKTLRFQARGFSMTPLIRDGDVLVVKPLGESGLTAGDVVLFTIEPMRMALHRIIRIKIAKKQRTYLLQGDQINHPDGWFDHGDIFGLLTQTERNGKLVMVNTPLMRNISKLLVFRARWNLRGSLLQKVVIKIFRVIPGTQGYFK